MQIRCLAVSMLWCSLFVADPIVGMEELELHYRCRGRCNFHKFKIALCWVRAASEPFLENNFFLLQRQGTEICNFGAPSPLEALHWIFCFFSSIYVQLSKTSPLTSGESSEKSSGENRVKSCYVCGCHGFFGPERWVFGKYPEMGPKVDEKWVLGCKRGRKWVKTNFLPTCNRFRDIDQDPLFTQFKGGRNCFPKRALRYSQPSITIATISVRMVALLKRRPFVVVGKSEGRDWTFQARFFCQSTQHSSAPLVV